MTPISVEDLDKGLQAGHLPIQVSEEFYEQYESVIAAYDDLQRKLFETANLHTAVENDATAASDAGAAIGTGEVGVAEIAEAQSVSDVAQHSVDGLQDVSAGHGVAEDGPRPSEEV